MHSRPLILFFALCLCASVACGQSISSFSPAYGAPNVDTIVIEGSGFTTVTNVTFYPNKSATSWHVSADTQISAVIPTGATTGPITVKKPGGTATSIDDLTVIGPGPYITDLSATNGSVGSPIQINGVHFAPVPPTGGVKFNGVNATYTITTDQQITATIPANATSGTITVTSSSGTGTSPVNFYFPPGVTNVSPFFGRAGTNVVIKGTNFLNASKVLFGSVNAAYVTNSLTQITAIVPVGAISGPVRVVTPGGQYITSSNFIVLPDISSISPIAGNENSVVTINGSNLTVGGNPTVSFNGLLATLFGTPTSSQIFARAPIGGSSGPITVQTSEGTAISPTNFYYPPVISGLFPTNGPSGTTVTISGKNFTNASAVVFSANSATNFTVVDNTMITAVVPPGEVTGAISVTTPGGTTASLQTFFGTPIIKTFSPQAGVAGVPVTITGTNLSNVKKVLFNGTAAQTATNVNESVIVANVPLGATTGLITVQNFGGSVNSATAFIIDPLLLSITNLNSNIVAISWTTNAVGYSLQFTTNLLTTNNTWSNEPVSVQIIGGKNTVTNSATNAQKFYRLRN